MHMHLMQAHVWFCSMDDETLGTWRAFLNAHAHITRRISRDLAAAGLPDLSWYDLLWAIYSSPDRRLRVNEIAKEVVLSPTAMSRFVARVEEAGYVRREVDPRDRRAFQIAITDEGVDLLRRMWPVYEAGIEAHFAAHLKNATKTRAMLAAMAESASRPQPPAPGPPK
jgi:DNA-binding MarR family transcriptional regulator